VTHYSTKFIQKCSIYYYIASRNRIVKKTNEKQVTKQSVHIELWKKLLDTNLTKSVQRVITSYQKIMIMKLETDLFLRITS